MACVELLGLRDKTTRTATPPRVDTCGAPRRIEAGSKANRGKNGNREHERERIARLEPKEQRTRG